METTPTTPTESSKTNLTKARNTFLTVICILSFIGSGLGLAKSIRDYATADTIANIAGGALKTAQSEMDNQNTPAVAKDIFSSVSQGLNADNIRKMALMSLISNILTLTGALLMWNLKKLGFYSYILGIIVGITAPLMIGGVVGIFSGAISGLIGIVFIIMYGVNLKQMNTPSTPMA